MKCEICEKETNCLTHEFTIKGDLVRVCFACRALYCYGGENDKMPILPKERKEQSNSNVS